MKRMGMLIAGLLMMVLGGGVVYIKANLETITQTIAATVESATGQPLILEDRPSLSIFPQLGLAMDAGRWGNPAQDALSVTFQGAVVRVSLMGLLQRRIEFTELTLDAPHVVYREPSAGSAPTTQSGQPVAGAADGDAGYILGRTAAPADRPKPQGIDLSRLALDAVRISRGEVTIEQGGTRTQLRQVAVQVDNLAPGKQGRMQVSLQLSTGAAPNVGAATGKIADPMTVDLGLNSRFELNNPVLHLQDVELSLKPVTGLALSVPVQVRGSMDVDTALLTLGALNLTAQLAELRTTVTGHMALADMSGQLELGVSGALRGALAGVGLLPDTADPAAFSSFDAHAMLKLGAAQVALSGLSGKLDTTTFSGDLTGTLPAGKAGQPAAMPFGLRGGLRIGALTVDKYLPAPKAGSAAATPATPATPAPAAAAASSTAAAKPESASALRAGTYPDVHLECSIEQLVVKKVHVSTVVAVLDGKQGQYALKPCTFTLYDSQAEASAQVSMPDVDWALTLKASGINAGALLKDAAGTNAVSGKATVQAQLRSKGEGAAMTSNLNGKITLNAQLAVESGLIPSEWSALMREVRTINMDNVDVVATITDGQVVLKPIQIKGKLLKAEGQGVINLPADTMDVQVNATLAGLPLPLVIQGSLSKPRYGINPAGLIKGLLNAPQEGAKDLEQGLKRLFKKL